MPRLSDASENIRTDSNYSFTAPSINSLGATEYTLATVVLDISSSVYNYRDDLEACLKTIVDACKKSPRAENLMLRVVLFSHRLTELHGFRVLNGIDVNDYTGKINPQGMTALFDATHTAIDAMSSYAKKLADSDFLANGIVFIVTDGDDNSSAFGATEIKTLLTKIGRDEVLESVRTVLVGVNDDPDFDSYLNDFQTEAGLEQKVFIGEATPTKLAKLADFISQSISSQSQSLGTGGPSQALSF